MGLVCPVGPAQAGFYNLSILDSLAHFFCKEQESSIVPKLPSTGRGAQLSSSQAAQASGDEALGEKELELTGRPRPPYAGGRRWGGARRAGPAWKARFPRAGGWGWTLTY